MKSILNFNGASMEIEVSTKISTYSKIVNRLTKIDDRFWTSDQKRMFNYYCNLLVKYYQDRARVEFKSPFIYSTALTTIDKKGYCDTVEFDKQ